MHELLHCVIGALAQDAATGTAAASDPIANHRDSVTARNRACSVLMCVITSQLPTNM
jgi:hypothetical protein